MLSFLEDWDVPEVVVCFGALQVLVLPAQLPPLMDCHYTSIPGTQGGMSLSLLHLTRRNSCLCWSEYTGKRCSGGVVDTDFCFLRFSLMCFEASRSEMCFLCSLG